MREKYDVFISCKSEDYPLGRQIYDFLSNKGKAVFLADKNLRKLGISDYGRVIDDAIEGSTHMLVVSSSVKYIMRDTSPYVYYEWHTFSEEICLRRAKFSQQHRTKSVTHESAKLISRQS